jgi:protein O-GlcNAcase/histone acetyltransferase
LAVGLKYTSDENNYLSGQGWRFYNLELALTLHPGIQILWTGPQVYSPTIAASDLTLINKLLGQKVMLWDNWPKTPAALTGRAVDLPTAASGLLSCPVLNQYNLHPVADFWPVLGTAADYAWRPDTYVPEESLNRWQKSVQRIVP